MVNKSSIYIIECFGFESMSDLGGSLFHYKSGMLLILKTGSIFGFLATLIEKFIGVEPAAYAAFLMLIMMEFATGLSASLKEGCKIESRRFGRMIVKIAIYSVFLGILNIFKNYLSIPTVFSFEIDIYAFLFYVTLNSIIVQLVISVFENLGRLGFMEANLVLRVIKKHLDKYFKLD